MNIHRMLLSGVMAALCLAAGGCQLPIFLAEVMFPYDKIPAKFKLPEGKKVLVFPDDLTNPVSYTPVKRTLAQRTGEMLKAEKLVSEVISYDQFENLRISDPDFNHKDIQTIGRKLGADLILYISIEQFSLKDNPVEILWRGRFKTKIKIIDVHQEGSKARLWPEESAGYPAVVTEPEVENASEAFGTDLAKIMAGHLAEEIISLFKDHEVDRFSPKKTEEQPDLP